MKPMFVGKETICICLTRLKKQQEENGIAQEQAFHSFISICDATVLSLLFQIPFPKIPPPPPSAPLLDMLALAEI